MAWRFFTKDGAEKQIAAAVTGGSANTFYGYDSTGALGFQAATVKLAELTPSGVASITTATLPTNLKHLRIYLSGRGDTGSLPQISMRFNGDSGANYNSDAVEGTSPTTVAGNSAGSNSAAIIGNIMGASDTANKAGSAAIWIPDYSGTTFHKTYESVSHYANTTNIKVVTWGGNWANTAAITTITFLIGAGNFVSGTRISIYGEP